MLGKPKYHSHFYQKLLQVLGEDHVSIKEIDRVTYARDCNFQSVIQVRAKHFLYPPDIIVWPKGPAEISRVVKLSRRYRVPLIPYGGGSGVCGGTVPTKGGVIIDMKRNRDLLDLNKKENWICVETGFNGEQLERTLNRKGYTLGHFPSSIYCSTVGGWVAARSAGQYSSLYGKIEDMVLAMEIVTPTGDIVQTGNAENHRDAMDWNQLFLGTEGTLGIVTKVWLRIHSLPQQRLLRGIFFPCLEDGMTAMRKIMQCGLQPMVVRLYDEIDTWAFLSGTQSAEDTAWFGQVRRWLRMPLQGVRKQMGGWALRQALKLPVLFNHVPTLMQERVLLILGFQGLERVSERQLEKAIEICLEYNGEDAGSALGEKWLENRYSTAYKTSPVFYQGAFLDTMEVATTWDKIEQLYYTVKEAIEPYALVMAHLSHAYHEGCSIYFTFVAYESTAPKSEALLDTIWKSGLNACLKVGGVISHHHGIGRLKVDFMDAEWNEGVEFLRACKKQWDRGYLMNPGKLIPFRE